MGYTRISRTEFVYDERARNFKCLLIFELPAQKMFVKIYFYKLAFTLKCVSLRKLAPSCNVLVVCTGTSSIRMAWTLSLTYLSAKRRLLMKKMLILATDRG